MSKCTQEYYTTSSSSYNRLRAVIDEGRTQFLQGRESLYMVRKDDVRRELEHKADRHDYRIAW